MAGPTSSELKPNIPVHHRLGSLDGWRAVSILLVLACHMLPLGPKRWDLNNTAGLMGMALFFTLSGFLITSTLLRSPSIPPFLIRRLARIVPLAWLATVVYLAIERVGFDYYWNTLGFTINYEHQYITHLTAPFWSLCVEVHFYAGVALLVGLLGLRGLLLLPLIGFAVTGLRVYYQTPVSIVTHLRVDEILAGATLALIWTDELGRVGRALKRILGVVPLPVWSVVYCASCHPIFGPLLYFRPYLAAALVGSTLFLPGRLDRWLTSRPARYVAEISYALYIIHTATMTGWLGSGGTAVKYAKRPLCFALTFGLAHLSTFYFERPWTVMGKRLSRHWADVSDRPTVGSIAEKRPVGDSL